MSRAVRILLLALATLGLGGCFEVELRSEVHADGSMTLHTDIAVEKAVIGLYGELLPPIAAAPGAKKLVAAKPSAGGEYAAHCKDGFKSLMHHLETEVEGKKPVPKRKDAKRQKAPPAPAASAMPAFMGTYTTRGTFEVCTLSYEVKDPVAELKQALLKDQSEEWTMALDPLPGGNGYRFVAEMLKSDELVKGVPEEQRAAMMGMLKGFEKWAIGLSLSGIRIENTNGTISADGRTVTWRIAVMEFLRAVPDSRSVVIKADVYFK
jgi:hypothetical protein